MADQDFDHEQALRDLHQRLQERGMLGSGLEKRASLEYVEELLEGDLMLSKSGWIYRDPDQGIPWLLVMLDLWSDAALSRTSFHLWQSLRMPIAEQGYDIELGESERLVGWDDCAEIGSIDEALALFETHSYLLEARFGQDQAEVRSCEPLPSVASLIQQLVAQHQDNVQRQRESNQSRIVYQRQLPADQMIRKRTCSYMSGDGDVDYWDAYDVLDSEGNVVGCFDPGESTLDRHGRERYAERYAIKNDRLIRYFADEKGMTEEIVYYLHDRLVQHLRRQKCFYDLAEALANPADVYRLSCSRMSQEQLKRVAVLTKLRECSMQLCDLETLPAEIGQLSELKSLDLRYNKLKRLPPEIGKLTRLHKLDLGHNKLAELPAEISELSALRHLYLEENRFTADGLAEIWDRVPRARVFTDLQEALGQPERVFQLNLCLQDIKTVPDELGRLVNLEILCLSESKFRRLPESFVKLRSLEVLRMDFCYCLDPERVFPVLAKLPKLRELSLVDCHLGADRPKSRCLLQLG